MIARRHLPKKLCGVRALVVDDVEMNTDILSHQLRALGMEVTTASDGFAALAEMERAWHCGRPSDVAFLDQMMPGLSGTVVAERVRASSVVPETKLVLVSSAGI